MRQNKIVNFNVDKKIYEELKVLSEAQGRTISELIREGICLVLLKYKDYIEEGGNNGNKKK